MKKFGLLLGTIGGALAGYILSNDKLRHELVKAKKPEDAAKLLGKHLAADGKKVGKEVKDLAKSKEVQDSLDKARDYAWMKYEEGKEKVQEMMSAGKKQAGKMMKKGAKKASKAAKNM